MNNLIIIYCLIILSIILSLISIFKSYQGLQGPQGPQGIQGISGPQRKITTIKSPLSDPTITGLFDYNKILEEIKINLVSFNFTINLKKFNATSTYDVFFRTNVDFNKSKTYNMQVSIIPNLSNEEPYILKLGNNDISFRGLQFDDNYNDIYITFSSLSEVVDGVTISIDSIQVIEYPK